MKFLLLAMMAAGALAGCASHHSDPQGGTGYGSDQDVYHGQGTSGSLVITTNSSHGEIRNNDARIIPETDAEK